MAYTPVTVNDFKTFFSRDFPFGATQEYVMDADVSRALSTAGVNFNEGLWSSQLEFNHAYLYLSAHYLVEAIRASSSGLETQNGGNTLAKAVGDVSESFQIPDRVKNNPFLAGLYTTKYGAIYVQLLTPRIVGNVLTVCGRTTR